MTTVTAVQHQDVRGKTLYYLKVQKGTREYIINVGKATHDTVKSMEDEPTKEVANSTTASRRKDGGDTQLPGK